jgi:predicted amidohydrolase
MKLRVATGQFPIESDIQKNRTRICRQVASAAGRGADVILFPETALTGYPGIDLPSFAGYDWDGLRRATEEVMDAAKRHGIWAIVGSNHQLSGGHKPHNCLYAIDPKGRLVNRYDKRFCALEDLPHYQAGTDPVVARIKGMSCGLLICHEWRYPELYRHYKKLKVDVILQAWYDGGLTARQMKARGEGFADVIPTTVQGHAACDHLWICGSNTSRKHSYFGACVVRPDGRFLQRQPRHRSGVMVCTIDTSTKIADLAAHARARAMRGVDRLGPILSDPRSTDRRCL